MEGKLDTLFQLHLMEVKAVIASNCAADITAYVVTLQPGSVYFLKHYKVYKLTQVILRN